MLISVIIPTYNRARSVLNLLASLRRIDCAGSVALEVIVVENGCTDGTAELLVREQEQALPFALRVLKEPQRGKAAAVNRGLAEAGGEILSLLDDDVVVHPAWLTEHARAHREAGFDAVQGRVLPGWDVADGLAADPAKLHEYNILVVDYGEQAREIRGFAGTNVSFKREVFQKCGFFDVRLGPGAAGFSEDTEYSRRVRAAGFHIGYMPTAIAYHELNPERYGRAYNRAVEYRKGLSRAMYRREPIFLKVVPRLLAGCIVLGVYRIQGKMDKVYKAEGRIMKSWGYLVGKLGRAGIPAQRGAENVRHGRSHQP
jgi:GT2 family glycosyltransferase